MSLLSNAIRSIQIGLEDYRDDDRLVSSTRNIFAGILLLFKHKLQVLSGANSNFVLIKQNVLPFIEDGVLVWKGVGDKTIDVPGIKSRFKSLGIAVDWNAFDRVNKYRNEVEHYYSSLGDEEVVRVLADCFIIISKFFKDYLNIDSREALGDESWKILLHAYEVYEYEAKLSEKLISSLTFHHEVIKNIVLSFECPACSSGLIRPTCPNGDADQSEYFCVECKSGYSYDEICDGGALDLYLDEFWSNKYNDASGPLSNCDLCHQGLIIKEYNVCTACGVAGERKNKWFINRDSE